MVDLNGANSIFGTIGAGKANLIGGRYDFVPLDGSGKTMSINGNGDFPPVWIGLENKNMQFWAYKYCSPLASVIDKLAEADTNGVLLITDEDGGTDFNYKKIPALARVMKLLKRPNKWQTWEEFNTQQIIYCKDFGYCPVLAIRPSGMDTTHTKALFNLNPFFAEPIENRSFDIYNDKSEPIQYWTCSIGGKHYGEIPAEDVFIVKDGYIIQENSNCLPISKVSGLDFWVSNICAAMEADNVLLRKKGPLGIFSYDPKPDMAGWTPMEKDDQDDLQLQLRKYGMTLNQFQYIISRMPIKWNAVSFNASELMTKESVRQGSDGICDRFGFPAELMSGKNATYENRRSAGKYLYENNTIPFSLRRMSTYSTFFELDYFGKKLKQDFSHLPILQEDLLKEGQAYAEKAAGFDIEWKAGLITLNEWRIMTKKKPIPDGDLFYQEWVEKYGKSLNLLANGNKSSKDSRTQKKKPADNS